jgi:hypothetical protein
MRAAELAAVNEKEKPKHPLWHASWVELQAIIHAVLGPALRIGAGPLMGLGRGVGGVGM